MRALAAVLLLLAFALPARANPALHGTWSAGDVNGRPLAISFEAGGGGQINGQPMKWQTLGKLLFIEQNGQVGTYSYDVQGDKVLFSGGDLTGVATLSRGTAAAEAALKKAASQPKAAQGRSPAGAVDGRELVGKWCQMSTFTANRGGGSQRSACFELRADGSYTYQYEGSMSASAPGMHGGSSSQSSDAGRWSVRGTQLVAQSRSGKTSSYALEKRNHPKNKRDPMICLDGECYVTFYNKPAWQ
jgi:hypothetical protein